MDQVLFTCLYLHAPAKIEDRSLKAFCHAVRHLIIVVRHIIMSSGVNEEEDFQLFGNSSLLAKEDTSLVALIPNMLKEAEDELVRQSKTSNQPEDEMAVVHRLRFMRHFYQALYSFDNVMASSVDEAAINEIYKHLNASLELTPQIKKIIEKGTQPKEGCKLSLTKSMYLIMATNMIQKFCIFFLQICSRLSQSFRIFTSHT